MVGVGPVQPARGIAEGPGELLAQLRPRAQEAHLDVRLAEPQRLRHLPNG